jgi:hypothetical protein
LCPESKWHEGELAMTAKETVLGDDGKADTRKRRAPRFREIPTGSRAEKSGIEPVTNKKASHARFSPAVFLLLFFLLLSMATPSHAADLKPFFSEYIKGSSNNKALEIYNPADAAIDLTAGAYNIQMFFNGSATAGATINLTGTIPARGVYVVAYSGASAGILAKANQLNGSSFYNGDDAIVLRQGTTILDRIGQVGFDPGTEWGSGLESTADNTLVRKPNIVTGDTGTLAVFDPAIQWTGYATDTFSYLGTHDITTYTVTYQPGARGTFGEQVISGLLIGNDTPAEPVTTGQPGWTFAGWIPERSLSVTGSGTYTAQWTQDEYTVSYEPGVHGAFVRQETTGLHYGDATPAAPAVTTGAPGWTFSGWDTTPSVTVTGSAAYTAQWTQDIYTVSYEPGAHGAFTRQETTGLHYGDATPAAPAVTTGAPGWSFAGWDTMPSVSVDGSAVYTAQWTQDEYTVSYEPGVYETFAPEATGSLRYGDATPALSAQATGQAHWTFNGWIPAWSASVAGNVTYAAQWKQTEYTVAYLPGDHGSFAAQSTSFLHAGDNTPAEPLMPGQPGWTFAGWDPPISPTVTGSATYTAQWTQDEYTVSYEPGAYGTFAPEATGSLRYGDATPALSAQAIGQAH